MSTMEHETIIDLRPRPKNKNFGKQTFKKGAFVMNHGPWLKTRMEDKPSNVELVEAEMGDEYEIITLRLYYKKSQP